MQSFSIIVTSRNRGEALARLLPELLALEASTLEVIVVDNESTDNTHEVAHSLPVRYIHFPGGLAEARHLGSMAATGDFITYVDDDCLPGHSRILSDIAKAFDEHPEAGIIGSRIEN